MELLDAKSDGAVAKILEIIKDVAFDILAAWAVLRLKAAKDGTNVVDNWKIVLAVKKYVKNVALLGAVLLSNALSRVIILSK